jgi:opacity protein-like surface antigen
MRALAMFGIIGMVLPSSAGAAVNDNLFFCSKLANSKERIACYDAAARIAAMSGSTADHTQLRRPLVSRPVADAPIAAAVYEPPTRSRFEGWYAAVGGGYGVTGPRQVQINSQFGFVSGLFDTAYSSGWSVSGLSGYNVMVGRWLFGIELDGRFSNERGQAEQINSGPNSFGLLSGMERLRYEIKSDAGVHLSGRIGATFENTLVFAKLGAGVTHVAEAFIDDASNAAFSFCTPCTPQIGVSRGASKSAWLPSSIFGFGVEQNFGAIFVRGQGEIEAAQLQETRHFAGSSTSNLYWTARAMGMVGVRF